MTRILPIALVLVAAAALLVVLFTTTTDPDSGPAPLPPPSSRNAPAPPEVRPEPPPPLPAGADAGASATRPAGAAGTTSGTRERAGAVAAPGDERPSLAEPVERDPKEVPLPVRARVRVELAGELEGAKVTAALFPKTEDGKAAPTEVRIEDGKVLIPDVGDGDYVLEIAAEKAGRVVRERRDVHLGEDPVELDPVRILPGAGIRARAVDAAGQPIPQAIVVAVREDEKPDQARRLTPGAGGWVLYGDLEPSSYHRVVALGLPQPLETTVRTPEQRGRATDVELRSDDTLVLCRVTIRLPDSAPAGAITIREGPLRPKLRPGERELLGQLLPGNYPIRAVVGSSGTVYVGRLAVPATGPFTGTLDLIPE